MPILHLKISAAQSSAMTEQISELLLDLTTRILKKKPEVTALTLDYVDRNCWLIGGKSLRELNQSSFYFDIKITDETNTKEEKAAYIAAAFAGFERILGDLHDTSYVYVEDVRGTAYGYGGLTQEYRYQHPVQREAAM